MRIFYDEFAMFKLVLSIIMLVFFVATVGEAGAIFVFVPIAQILLMVADHDTLRRAVEKHEEEEAAIRRQRELREKYRGDK